MNKQAQLEAAKKAKSKENSVDDGEDDDSEDDEDDTVGTKIEFDDNIPAPTTTKDSENTADDEEEGIQLFKTAKRKTEKPKESEDAKKPKNE